MKHIIYFIAFLLMVHNCHADVPDKILKDFRHIVELIKENKVSELSALVQYPLKRQNPLHDIADAKAFIAYYNTLIDAAFKKKLAQYDDSLVFEHNAAYGIAGGDFDGDIWIEDDGKISAINYSSAKEQELKKETVAKIKKQMHPSVNEWDENVLVAKSEKLLIRIDRISKDIRYVCWSKGHGITEKPDIVLYNGKEEAQGSMGGWTYTFVNGDWTYVVDDVLMCETEDKCGLFLNLLFKDNEKSSTKLKEIK